MADCASEFPFHRSLVKNRLMLVNELGEGALIDRMYHIFDDTKVLIMIALPIRDKNFVSDQVAHASLILFSTIAFCSSVEFPKETWIPRDVRVPAAVDYLVVLEPAAVAVVPVVVRGGVPEHSAVVSVAAGLPVRAAAMHAVCLVPAAGYSVPGAVLQPASPAPSPVLSAFGGSAGWALVSEVAARGKSSAAHRVAGPAASRVWGRAMMVALLRRLGWRVRVGAAIQGPAAVIVLSVTIVVVGEAEVARRRLLSALLVLQPLVMLGSLIRWV
ncbi:hypothetical protein CBR_g8006 [Chara braunii]|uniref:Uncharacterized protein n=1 Tax=Chara braunii TaxID=69332 RepID=A0A388KKZ9_CHABU|nr:hypothetical protein CBR_g8006 [Chara braunii]|eukprot:GBG70707.1 hypothetical protein CBR_g8006 [Chara braunii]